MLKRIVSLTPRWFQSELKRVHYGRQIRKGTFITDEPEFDELSKFVNKGDWVIDVGANVGHYTLRLSDLVGKDGRVIAFEPIPTTFRHLSENTRNCAYDNITLINAAVSETTGLVGMSVPKFANGMTNFYEANIVSENESDASDIQVLTLPIDVLEIPQTVKLIKIDAEGHEPAVLRGLKTLIARDRPIIIAENVNDETRSMLDQYSYWEEKHQNSPNIVFRQSAFAQ